MTEFFSKTRKSASPSTPASATCSASTPQSCPVSQGNLSVINEHHIKTVSKLLLLIERWKLINPKPPPPPPHPHTHTPTHPHRHFVNLHPGDINLKDMFHHFWLITSDSACIVSGPYCSSFPFRSLLMLRVKRKKSLGQDLESIAKACSSTVSKQPAPRVTKTTRVRTRLESP